MDCSKPGFPVHHQLLELAQTHVHWVSDAIQPPHPLLSLSPLAFNLSQHQGLFKNESVLHFRCPKYWSFSISPSNEYSNWFPLGWTGWISLQSKGLSSVFSNTTVQKHWSSCSVQTNGGWAPTPSLLDKWPKNFTFVIFKWRHWHLPHRVVMWIRWHSSWWKCLI